MSAFRFVSSVWKNFIESGGLEANLLDKLRLVNATPGKVNMDMQVELKHTNRLKSLHGGTIASLVDLGGSLAVSSRGMYSTGVSTDINVTYISSGGNVGDNISIECKCEKLGSNLAFTSVDFYRQDKLFARGSHTKYVAIAMKDVSLTNLYKYF